MSRCVMDEIAYVKLSQPVILVFDPLKLRRAGFGSFLRSWAEQMDLALAEAPPTVAATDSWKGAECRMAVLTVGGSTINGPEAQGWIERIRTLLPDPPLVIISDREDADEVIGAFRAGARGFIPTSIEPSIALQALTFILSGGSFFPPTALLHPGRRSDGCGTIGQDKADGTRVPPLTPKQQAVLELVREGKSNKVIARELGMRESTVKVHLRQIMRKLGASNRTQAALSMVEVRPPLLPHPPGTEGALPPPSEKAIPALALRTGVVA